MDEEEINQSWMFKIPPQKNDQLYKGKVILYYGPHEANNIIKYRPQRLRGLRDLLMKEGYIINCIPWEHYDRMAVLVNDSIIYTCRYSYMDFDGFGLDTCTKEAFKITMDTLNRINAWYLLKNLVKNVRTPHDFFSKSIG